MSDFSAETIITNAPITKISYRRTRRLRFLFASLRTRSLSAREQLARIATSDQHGFGELIELMKSNLGGEQVEITRNPARKKAMVDLGWLLHNQAVNADEDHMQLAAVVYRWVIKNDPKRFKSMHRQDLAILALNIGDDALLDFAKKGLPRLWPMALLPSVIRTKFALGLSELLNSGFVFGKDFSISPKLLQADITNPFRKNSQDEKWIGKFSKAILPSSASPLELATGTTVFDSLFSKAPRKIYDGPLVTVVVSCYKPNQALITSLKSILASSYENLEVMVFDDASPKGYKGFYNQAEALDLRVRVYYMKQNGGTYAVRNRALEQAQGDLITFQDSDDWMHPERIERQVKRLRSQKRIGNISMSTRVDENLGCVESGRRLRIGLCEPSLMFWRKQVVNKIGYFDSVRKGADSEYRKRIQKAFEQDLEVIEPYRTLTLQRSDHGGLTDGDMTFRWIVDYRLAYRDSYNRWQKSAERLYLKPGSREFFAPRQMRFKKELAYKERTVDLLMAANFCDPSQEKKLLAEIEKALEKKLFIGLHQLNTMYPLALPRSIRASFIEILEKGYAHLVYPDDKLEIRKLKVYSPSAYLVSYQHRKYRWLVRGMQITPLAEKAETWNAEGEGLDELLQKRLGFNFSNIDS